MWICELGWIAQHLENNWTMVHIGYLSLDVREKKGRYGSHSHADVRSAGGRVLPAQGKSPL